MKLRFTKENQNIQLQIISNQKTVKKSFFKVMDIFLYLKDRIPLAEVSIEIDIEHNMTFISTKNIIEKIIAYQINNGITSKYLFSKQSLQTLNKKSGSKFDLLKKIAQDTEHNLSQQYQMSSDKSLYALYCDVLLENVNSIMQSVSEFKDSIPPRNIILGLKDIKTSLNNLITKGYAFHKGINITTLRNKVSTILLKYESVESSSQSKSDAQTNQNSVVMKLNDMVRTKNFTELYKYLHLITNKSVPDDIKLDVINTLKYSENITLMNQLIKLYPNLSDNLKERIVWALGDYIAPHIFKFLKETLLNQNENKEVRISAALALTNYPDDKGEIKKILDNIRNLLIVKSHDKKYNKKNKIKLVIKIKDEEGNEFEGILQVFSKKRVKFITSNLLKINTNYEFNIPEIFIIKDTFIKVELLFSVYSAEMGVYINRGKFVDMSKEVIHNIYNFIHSDSTSDFNLKSYIKQKNIIESSVFPCKFHPNYSYENKIDFFQKNRKKCSEIMYRNFYFDVGFNWKALKCMNCEVRINKVLSEEK